MVDLATTRYTADEHPLPLQRDDDPMGPSIGGKSVLMTLNAFNVQLADAYESAISTKYACESYCLDRIRGFVSEDSSPAPMYLC